MMVVNYLWILISFPVMVVCYKHICPDNNPNDPLEFRQKPARLAFSRVGHLKKLSCCATGFTYFTWYKRLKNKYLEFPWFRDDDTIDVEEGKQVLVFYQTRMIKDAGYYKCVGKNKTHSIENLVHLKIIDCEVHNSKIYIDLKPEGPITADIGDSINITCEGNFGCLTEGEENDRIAQWEYKDSGKPKTPRNSSKFTTIDYTKGNGSIYGSVLTIRHIETIDYSRSYICVLKSPADRNGFNVTIQPSKKIILGWYWYLFSLFGIVVIFGIVIWVCFYKSKITFWYKKKFGSFPDPGKTSHDMLLLYADADKSFVKNKFHPHLKEYKIFDKDSVPPGERELTQIKNNIQNCFCIVFIYSKALLIDPEVCDVFSFIQAEPEKRNIIIVLLEKLKKQNLPHQDNEDNNILNRAPSVYPTVKWPSSYPEQLIDNPEQLIDNPEQLSDNKTIKLSRKQDNFFCCLKNKLPRRSATAKPVMDNQNTVTSTTSADSSRPLLYSVASYEEHDLNISGATTPKDCLRPSYDTYDQNKRRVTIPSDSSHPINSAASYDEHERNIRGSTTHTDSSFPMLNSEVSYDTYDQNIRVAITPSDNSYPINSETSSDQDVPELETDEFNNKNKKKNTNNSIHNQISNDSGYQPSLSSAELTSPTDKVFRPSVNSVS